MSLLALDKNIQKFVNQGDAQPISSVFKTLLDGLNSAEDLANHLQRVATERQVRQAQHYYLSLPKVNETHLSYSFSPIILSVLKYKTRCISPQSEVLEQVLANYFRLDALNLQHNQALTDMDLCFDLQSVELTNTQLHTYSVLKALFDPNCQQVLVLGDELDTELLAVAKTYGIEVSQHLMQQQTWQMDQVNFKTLFWKRKSEDSAAQCQTITQANTALVQHLSAMNLADTARLIDDLMYSEHMFEKVSVFGEFTETIYKQQML